MPTARRHAETAPAEHPPRHAPPHPSPLTPPLPARQRTRTRNPAARAVAAVPPPTLRFPVARFRVSTPVFRCVSMLLRGPPCPEVQPPPAAPLWDRTRAGGCTNEIRSTALPPSRPSRRDRHEGLKDLSVGSRPLRDEKDLAYRQLGELHLDHCHASITGTSRHHVKAYRTTSTRLSQGSKCRPITSDPPTDFWASIRNGWPARLQRGGVIRKWRIAGWAEGSDMSTFEEVAHSKSLRHSRLCAPRTHAKAHNGGLRGGQKVNQNALKK